MIELERHIEILLLNNDCVIVPGIGGFMAYHVEARYDERDHTFLPPLRALGFNPQLTSLNDSLLAQSYVEAYDISYPEATRRIEAEVKEVRQALDTHRSYELHNIGTLYINEEGKMEFSPCEAGILSPSLYGLNSLEMEKLPSATAIQEQPVATTPKRESIRNPHTAEEQSQQLAAASADPVGDPTIHIKVSWLRNFAAAAAAVVAFLCLSVPVKNSQPNLNISKSPNETMMELVSTAQAFAQKQVQEPPSTNEEQQTFEEVTLDNVRKTEQPATDAAQAETATSAKEAATAITKEPATATKEPATATKEPATAAKEPAAASKASSEEPAAKHSYYIVLASRVSKVNAEYFIGKLHQKGLDKAALYTHNHINRVVYGSYATETEAHNALRQLRDLEEFEQAWVYQEK
ncbi:MAG: SPOR domain-containing protein [Prevotella sp.]